MAPVEDIDSGMESQEGSQVDTTAPEEVKSPASSQILTESVLEPATSDKKSEIQSEFDDEPDESFGERLWGLTEMFPESVRTASQAAAISTQAGVKSLYTFSRSAFWVVFSTSIILFAPVIFEVERAQMEEMQRSQQKQMLLGPNTAVSGGILPPPMQR